MANQELHQGRLRIDHVNSSSKRCRSVKDRSRLWKDTVGEFGGTLHAHARAGGAVACNTAVKREWRVCAFGHAFHHASKRIRLIAVAVNTCCRWIFANPR